MIEVYFFLYTISHFKGMPLPDLMQGPHGSLKSLKVFKNMKSMKSL